MPRRIVPAPVPPGSKWCYQCSTAQPVQRFQVDRGTADGRRYACRRCIAEKERSRARIKRAMTAAYFRHTVPL